MMAIDGINIIDSDLAHDIYNGIVEAWRDGEPLEKLLEPILSSQRECCDDDEIPEVYEDIYWAALAYSLWKIGHLSDEILHKFSAVVERGASQQWAIVCDEKAVKLRQKKLEQLLQKLQTTNPKPYKQRPLKRTKSTAKPYFEVGDVVVIKYPDDFKPGYYGAFLVVAIEHTARKKEYHFAVTRYFEREVPSLTDILKCDILYREQIGFDSSCWFAHKNLTPLLPCFEKIANVELVIYRMGVLSPANDLEDFYQYVDKNDPSYGGKTKKVVDVIKNIVEQLEEI